MPILNPPETRDVEFVDLLSDSSLNLVDSDTLNLNDPDVRAIVQANVLKVYGEKQPHEVYNYTNQHQKSARYLRPESG